MTPPKSILAIFSLAAFQACGPQSTIVATPKVASFSSEIPKSAAPDTCWDKQVTPAVIETVTRHIIIQPAEIRADGSVSNPAVYKTERVQQIVETRQENWFQTPCQETITEDFIASLQRALSVRGYYVWPVNGEMDSRTSAAVRRYQKSQGLDSSVLSLAAAQQLGLASVEPALKTSQSE